MRRRRASLLCDGNRIQGTPTSGLSIVCSLEDLGPAAESAQNESVVLIFSIPKDYLKQIAARPTVFYQP